jgi:hypothetical protein
MIWEDNEVAMKPRGLIMETNVQQHIYRIHVEDSPIIKEAESHKMKIFATYHNGHTHLDLEGGRNILFKKLSKYPELFSGGLDK